jgi:primosomal protein N' (replication factor Y) (superfamily II helicase)
VNALASRGASTFHYSIPPELPLMVGQMVWVPFGAQTMQGVVLGLPDDAPERDLKPVINIADPIPVLTTEQIHLARWMADYYCAPLVDAIQLMLPPGIEQHSLSFVSLNALKTIPANISPRQRQVIDLARQHGQLRLDRLSRFGLGLRRAAGELLRAGLLVRRFELQKPRVKAKIEVWLEVTPIGADPVFSDPMLGRAPSQSSVLDALRLAPGAAAPLSTLLKETNAGKSAADGLVNKGLANYSEREVWRDPPSPGSFPYEAVPKLTLEQEAAWKVIQNALDDRQGEVQLLHGVTGSGKTELYLRAAAEVLAKGQTVIVLVPEIVLTPQTVHRFASRFPGRIAIQHSQLTPGERFDQWRRLRDGTAAVVVGPRSALFAPLRNLGLIVIDEEHEWTYKQDSSPRYHTRNVARKLAELTGAPLILGSATPDLISYYHAQQGQYTLLRLTDRVQGGALPPVHLVDMRRELREGNRSIFSRALAGALSETLASHEQSILFINRRGTATFIICRDCGHTLTCGRCDIPLVYHTSLDGCRIALLCHLCNRETQPPLVCPACQSSRIRYFGVGTEKVETEVRKAFPQARVLRWDRDVSHSKQSYEKSIEVFARHEADILVGTQMVAKGLDLPMVTLVGVVAADTALHLPDYLSAERTFQLLAQVSGRAGRRDLPGRVVVQTYSPDHYAIQAASLHDYSYFYQRELEFRRQHDYPPFGSLVRLLYSGSGELRAQTEADRFGRVLRRQVELLGLPATDVLGPAPSFWRKVRSRFRWQIILRGHHVHELIHSLDIPPHWVVDVDPVSVL